MNRASHVGRNTFGLLAAGVAGVLVSLPSAQAQGDPEPPPAPATTAPAPAPADAAAPVAAPVDDCNAATLAQTISSVTSSLSQYFAAHPDANQALIDITRQSSFVAIGQVDGYFAEHPEQADEIRAINAPLTDFKNRCGLQVSPTDALTVLADI
jgi:heme-binding protein